VAFFYIRLFPGCGSVIISGFREVHLSRKMLWGGRFKAAQDPFFAKFNDSLSFDWELLEADIEGSMAYARALERAGIFSRAERKTVENGLRFVLDQSHKKPNSIAASHAEDIHSYVEETLKNKIGPLALRLHTGRSRNDQVATDLRLYLRQKEFGIDDKLVRLLRAIVDLAQKHISVILPGYTHLQRAQPVLFSHYLLAYGEMLLRDRQRLQDALKRINICPLGSGALSGTVYNIDRIALAKDLSFSSASANSMDAVADRDFVLDFLFFASTLLMHLSRFSEDLILYNSAEFSFVQLDDSIASGSSLMPQKKNPDALELIRAKAGRVLGHLVALTTVLKGLPMTYNKDLQEDKEGLFDAILTVENCIEMMHRVVENICLCPDRMQESTVSGYLNATELADYLVSKKVPFRDAHEIAGKIVVRASELGIALEEMPMRDYQSFSPIFADDLYRWLKLDGAVSRRKELGGTSPACVRKSIASFKTKLRMTN
jgi:argininosuccinate lyase / amino-acid N-acetyltransferase